MGGPLRGFAIARPRPAPPVGSGLCLAVAGAVRPPRRPVGGLRCGSGPPRAVWAARPGVRGGQYAPCGPLLPSAALPPRGCGSPPRRPSLALAGAWRSAALRRAGASLRCARRWGVPPPAGGGHGDHRAAWTSWLLRMVWPWLSWGMGFGPFRAVLKGNRPPPLHHPGNRTRQYALTRRRSAAGSPGRKIGRFYWKFSETLWILPIAAGGPPWYSDSTKNGCKTFGMMGQSRGPAPGLIGT